VNSNRQVARSYNFRLNDLHTIYFMTYRSSVPQSLHIQWHAGFVCVTDFRGINLHMEVNPNTYVRVSNTRRIRHESKKEIVDVRLNVEFQISALPT